MGESLLYSKDESIGTLDPLCRPHLCVMRTATHVTWDGPDLVGWETIVSHWRKPVQWHAILHCHLNVMQIARFVMQELTCMDAGWEIFASQLNFHVHKCVPTRCQLNVMKIASLVTMDGMGDVGWETTVSPWRKNVL